MNTVVKESAQASERDTEHWRKGPKFDVSKFSKPIQLNPKFEPIKFEPPKKRPNVR
jgi:hypothetical protein